MTHQVRPTSTPRGAWRWLSTLPRAYASNDKLAALTVAGSVGTGLADRFSDLELGLLLGRSAG
jgi:hypothetical protein